MVATTKIRLIGTLVGGEAWSIGCSFDGPSGPVPMNYPDLEGWATRVAAGELGLIVTPPLRSLLSSAATIERVRAEQIAADGTLAEVAEVVPNNAIVGVGSVSKALSTAVVFSLYTGRPGRSYRGRIYWPGLAAAVETASGRFTTANCQTWANSMALWLAGVAANGPAGANLRPVVTSQTRGVSTPITQIRVGDIPDVQRRRRDALVEGYSSAVYPPP